MLSSPVRRCQLTVITAQWASLGWRGNVWELGHSDPGKLHTGNKATTVYKWVCVLAFYY